MVIYQNACEHFCLEDKREAGGCQEMEAGVRWRPFGYKQNRRLELSSLLASSKAACEALRGRRLKEESGRRGSNPRQPAWKAGTLPLSYSRLLKYRWGRLLYRSGCADLNRGPHGPKPCALPTAPHPVEGASPGNVGVCAL